jgi:hypothetical protein
MYNKKYIKRLLSIAGKSDIQLYQEHEMHKFNLSFEGTPRKHPIDRNKVILLTDPFSDDNEYYEFHISTISHVEDIGTIASEDGQSVPQVRIWVKKGSPAIRHVPFIV